MPRTVTAGLVAAVVLLPACGDDDSGERASDAVVHEVDVEAGGIEVAAGEVVAVQVQENASVGDAWSISDPPDLAVAYVEGTDFESDDPDADGAGGTLTFLVQTVAEGETSLTLRNCFRCPVGGVPGDGGDAFAESVSFDITVGPGNADVDGLDVGGAVVIEADDPSAEVEEGDLVVVELDENSSIGDDWQLWDPPEGAVAVVAAEFFEPESPGAVGAGGTTRFVFRAVGPGDTSLSFHNCYRCDNEGNSPEGDADLAVDLVFELRVS